MLQGMGSNPLTGTSKPMGYRNNSMSARLGMARPRTQPVQAQANFGAGITDPSQTDKIPSVNPALMNTSIETPSNLTGILSPVQSSPQEVMNPYSQPQVAGTVMPDVTAPSYTPYEQGGFTGGIGGVASLAPSEDVPSVTSIPNAIKPHIPQYKMKSIYNPEVA